MKLTLLLVLVALSSRSFADIYDCEVSALEMDPETSIVQPTTLGKMAVDPDKDDTHTVEIEKDKLAATCTIVGMGCCGTGKALVCSFQGGPAAARPDLRELVERRDQLHSLGVTTTESKYFQFTGTKSITGGDKAYSIACLLISSSATRAEYPQGGAEFPGLAR